MFCLLYICCWFWYVCLDVCFSICGVLRFATWLVVLLDLFGTLFVVWGAIVFLLLVALFVGGFGVCWFCRFAFGLDLLGYLFSYEVVCFQFLICLLLIVGCFARLMLIVCLDVVFWVVGFSDLFWRLTLMICCLIKLRFECRLVCYWFLQFELILLLFDWIYYLG